MPTSPPKLPIVDQHLHASGSGHRPKGDYVLGTRNDESTRLGLQHRLWSAATHTLWEKAQVVPGQSVLDIGCGPGHASMDLAQIVGPTGRVIAIDESATFLKQLHDNAVSRKFHHIERVLGDVQDLTAVLAHEAGQIDLAYARWVFCFLSNPGAVIDGLSTLLKPGGRVAVQDYFNYERSLTLAPRSEAFTKVIHAVAASWRARGGDTDVMGVSALALTAFASGRGEANAIESGFDAHLAKPVDISRLTEIVTWLAKQNGSGGRGKSRTGSLA